MPTVKLTKTAIEGVRVKGGEAPVFLWDAQTKGFGVRVTAAKVAFVVQLRRPDKTTVRYPLGFFPALSVEEARLKAIELLTSKPPSLIVHSGHTVASLMRTFITDYVEKRHKPLTKRTEISLIENHIIPSLGPLTLDALTRPKVTEWHGAIKAPIAANRALAHLSKACSFAIQRDWMQHNPCKGIERNKEVEKDRYLTDAELTAIFNHPKLVAAGTVHKSLVALALTGLRTGELLPPFHHDSDRAVLQIRDSKTGFKTVPINKVANKFLKQNRCLGVKYKAIYDLFSGVTHDLKLHDVTIHTLRHTLATYMAQHGDSAFQIAAMGGWKSLAMVQRYVSLHGMGTPHPLPAGERIAKAIGLEV